MEAVCLLWYEQTSMMMQMLISETCLIAFSPSTYFVVFHFIIVLLCCSPIDALFEKSFHFLMHSFLF